MITAINKEDRRRQDLERKARKHYIHFLKFTVLNNENFDHPICYNGKLLDVLNVTRDRWVKLKV